MRLLIIEDDTVLAQSLKEGLADLYAVDLAFTGKTGAYAAVTNEYDIIILDLGLPDISGFEVCKEIRRAQSKSSILILTGKDAVEEKVRALDEGADDYLTKPFNLGELLARLRAMMRRATLNSSVNLLTVNGLTLDVVSRTVKRDGVSINLRRKEFDLLEYLMRNPDRVITRTMILEHIWDATADLFTNVVDVHIKYLRDQVDRPFSHPLIHTVHGVGYKISYKGNL